MDVTTTTPRSTVVASTKAQSYTFGIEIETLLPARILSNGYGDNGLRIGGYHRGIEIPVGHLGFPCRGWKLERDSSISTSLRTHRAVEIVSPILKGIDGLEQVKRVAQWLNDVGARTNATCGTHIHVGAQSVVGGNKAAKAKWIANLINLTAQYEHALQGVAGSRRRTEGRWCRSIHDTPWMRSVAEQVHNTTRARKSAIVDNASFNRYRTLNLANLQSHNKPTVEFRVFSGTTEGLKMTAWIQLVLGLAERAAGRKVKEWNRPDEHIYRGGDAQRQLDRYFYLQGWTAGRKVKSGDCPAAGWIDSIDNIEGAKKELRRLAKKFDESAAH